MHSDEPPASEVSAEIPADGDEHAGFSSPIKNNINIASKVLDSAGLQG